MDQEESMLSIAYAQFCREFAAPRWKSLLEALIKHAGSMEFQFDHKTFASDLVGRPLQQPRFRSSEAIGLLRDLITLNHTYLDPEAFLMRAAKKLERTQDLQAQIDGLKSNLTASALLKISALAQAGHTEILASKEWFKDEVDSFIPLVRGWQRFYIDWERVSRKGALPAKKNPVSSPVVDTRPSALPPSARFEQLQTRVHELEGQLEARTTELSDARSELFSLRTFKENLAIPVHRPEPLATDTGLVRRVAMRESMTPTDVLLFIEFISEGRVVVLESAWKSAKEASSYQQTGRMLELLHQAVYPYYEALMAGTPDATARKVLGNAYAANESDTVGAQRKLRRLREFEYEGKVHYFERHLKAGNGTGQDGMRIHFDIIGGKVVIAYAGPHLECATSN